ncbi:MAG: T9SS type A sorting domain-containing protein [Chitinophagales bacterium]
MKGFIWTLLINIFLLTVHGQGYYPLIRSDFYWDVMNGQGTDICNVNSGNRYFFQGDTLISGHLYKKVKAFPIVQLNPGPYCPPFAIDDSISWSTNYYLREDTAAKQVFIYNHDINSDDLIYDFSLEAGDTLRSNYAGQGIDHVIDSVGVVTLLNGVERKIFFLNNDFNYIESLGGSAGLQFPMIMGIGFWTTPECIRENNVLLWGNNCINYVGINEKSNNNLKLKLFPNPCNDYINIDIEYTSQSIFKLFDLSGKLKFKKNISGNHAKIHLSNLSAGIYLYQIENENDELLKVGKIINANQGLKNERNKSCC